MGEKSWYFGHVPLRLKSIRWQEVVQFTLNLHWQTLSRIFYNFLLREIRNFVIRVQPSTILGGVLLCKGCHKLHRFGADQSQVLQLGPCMTIKWQQPDFRQNKKYIEIYVTWLYLVFMYILPFLLLTVLNGLIYAEVSFLVGCDTISFHLHLWWLRMCRWDEQEMWGQSSLGVRQINKTIFPHRKK